MGARRDPSHGGITAAAFVAALLGAPGARADGTEPIRIAVTAPPECTSTDAFTADVTARTARARPARPGEVARSFTVTITATAKKARGTLVIDDPRGHGGSREVSGESCAEVASALALVTALAIDPRASTAARPPKPPPAPSPPKPRPVVLPTNPRLPPPYTPLPWWGPIGAPLPVLPWTAGARWRVVALLELHAASAVGPHVLPVLSGAVDVARIGPGLLSPAFRLSLQTADSGDLHVMGLVSARFRWAAARVEGCPLRVQIVGPLAALPCALFEAGALGATGLTPYAPRPPVTRPWLAPGLLGRVQADLLGGLLVEIDGGALFPLVRDTFEFAPAVTAHAIPVAGGFVGGGVGLHFP